MHTEAEPVSCRSQKISNSNVQSSYGNRTSWIHIMISSSFACRWKI